MTYLSFLAHFISKLSKLSKRGILFLLLFVVTLAVARPLLVHAEPAMSVFAQLAQNTPSPQPEEDEPEDTGSSMALPSEWQGAATISAQQLEQVAPPLQAEVSQGDFQIAYVPAETGNSLRILPVPSAAGVGALRVGMKLDENSTNPALPSGQIVTLQLTARLYGPDALARLTIADDNGSSSVVLDGVSWREYEVTRQLAANVTELEVMVEWSGVPANGWLEMRGWNFAFTPSAESAALSPTDTPTPAGAAAVATNPPTATPTPTVPVIATATPLPIATALPATSAPEQAPQVEATEPSSDVLLIPTPTLVIVTSTPTPASIFEEATRVAQATEWARVLGPVTATPPNMATPTPTVTPVVLVNTPTPENGATATQVALLATAIAFTTGTPTPIPPDAVILIATDTPIPPTATPRATNTPTPIFVLLDEIPVAQPTITPGVPAVLQGKIVFLTDYRGNPRAPNAMMINPDGTGAALLTTNFFYTAAAARDQYSADGRFYVYSLREAGGEAHNAGLIQIFYDDSLYSSTHHQLTYFGDGVAWSPAWSPNSETIAYVSSETGNDEIWVSQRNQWPATQLTKNEWEWDHHPSFSPNGAEIVFSSNRGTGNRQLWMMDSSGGNQRQFTNFPFEAWDPVWVKYVESPAEPAATPTPVPPVEPAQETTSAAPVVCEKGGDC
ncbi:MAG: PD40 domain-containing protein [Caldilineaceae bacterium]|nr:PD40 domain-containing protein [Caldilineaceae bacterium]